MSATHCPHLIRNSLLPFLGPPSASGLCLLAPPSRLAPQGRLAPVSNFSFRMRIAMLRPGLFRLHRAARPGPPGLFLLSRLAHSGHSLPARQGTSGFAKLTVPYSFMQCTLP